ncbi:MAG: A24 family peptidase [Phycisphaerae bacterium]|jgi:prepilin signal peptidase PulO-like enzyme (type II secretory pathway)|nr:A24 family peptidase [Phycisphaerae bacterium]
MINLVFVIAFAACVGSFLNVVIYRLPRGQSLSFPGSRCPSCGYAIKWYDNIPMLSWLILKGKCRHCSNPISPRYLVVEAATAAMVAGLFICCYQLDMREGLGAFQDSWITFIAYGALVAGLLACSIIDIEHWIVPLEVCWAVSVIGVLAATISPPAGQILPQVSEGLGAAGLGALVGLAISLILLRKGKLQPSFIDAENRPISHDEPADEQTAPAKPDKPQQGKKKGKGKRKGKKKNKNKAHAEPSAKPEPAPKPSLLSEAVGEVLFLTPLVVFGGIAYLMTSTTTVMPGSPVLTNRALDFCIVAMGAAVGLAVSLLLRRMGIIQKGLLERQAPPPAVAITKEHGVNPRLEILWEVLFLTPAILLAIGAYMLVTKVPPLQSAWDYLNDARVEYVNSNYTYRSGWRFAANLRGLNGAVFGYLIGGAWIWGIRILGTLGFGKEAMGLGDVHILAAVGAVCGWIAPSLVFFGAPFMAMLWALHLLASGRQRELPYGPWLAAAALVVILFYDAIIKVLEPSFKGFVH